MPTILDQYGQPIRTSALAEPQTAHIAALAHELIDAQLDGITPARAARILRQADQGDIVAQHQLFDDMLDRDAHLRCEWDKRSGAPLTLDWAIEPPARASGAEKKAAAWVEETLRDVVDDLEDVILSLMDGAGHGFAAIELEWTRDGVVWLPRFHPRPQTWFQASRDRRSLRLRDGSAEGAEPIPMGWMLHQHRKVKTGYLGRAGLFRAVLWPFLYKAYSIGDFAEFLETYGLPIIVGKFASGASEDDKSSLLRAVTALGSDARAIMPEGMSIEIQQVATGSGGGGNKHLEMVAWADAAQSKAILGQVLSAEAKATGLGSGVANLHAEVRRDFLLSDCRQLAGTLTRDLVYPLIALNRPGIDGLKRCPRWVFDTGESEDLARYAAALPALAAGGARIPVAWVHEKLRIPLAEEGEAVFGSLPSPTGGGAGGEGTALAALTADPAPTGDAIDAAIAAELATWEAVSAPLTDPIEAAMAASVAAGETAAEFIARLPWLLAEMDADPLAERLAQMATVARLAGTAGVEP